MTIDRATIEVYDASAASWLAARAPKRDRVVLDRLLSRVHAQGADRVATRVLDVGCGAGLHLADMPEGSVGIDASMEMLRLASHRSDHQLLLADAAVLPFKAESFDCALASRVHIHLPRVWVPSAFAELHRVLRADAPVELVMFEGDQELVSNEGDQFPGRRFSLWHRDQLQDILVGAGFSVEQLTPMPTNHWTRLDLGLRRLLTLPDTVGPEMRVLVCGLNPSVHAAKMGVGFGRAGNRFWPAALAAGLVTADRDPRHALLQHRVGMTDLVKRATPRADQLTAEEYASGIERLERLCRWLRPTIVCMVGLAGWRAAVDRQATAGLQDRFVGGRPVYVMPSTSGLNAHSRLEDLAEHLREVRRISDP